MGRKPSTAIKPSCDKRDCFANESGACQCLRNNDFWYRKDKSCPFYKSRAEYEKEIQRLKEKGPIRND